MFRWFTAARVLLLNGFTVVLFNSAFALLGLFGTPMQAEAIDRPNVVLVMADDQGWGDVGFRGHSVVKTPVMDELAATGLRFDRFYAAAPVCSPTRGSVLTGRHPNRFGCFSWGHTLRPEEITVAEALQSAGYATGHFGKWHLGSVEAGNPVCPGESGFDEWFSSPNFFENDPLMSHRGKVVQAKGESSQVTVDAALEFIRASADRKQPFLAVVWFGSPHSPHLALDADRALYKDQPEKLQHFYGEITAMDRAIGVLRRELVELGVSDNTLFWYTSDNGALPVGSTGGLTGLKGSLGEGGIRVPAMIEWPGRIKEPRTITVPCGTVDIFPTLLDIVGVDVPNQPPLDGVSLVPLLEGGMTSRAKPLGFWVYPQRGVPMRSTEMLKQLAAKKITDEKAKQHERGTKQTRTEYPDDQFPGPAAWIDGDYKLHRRVSKSSDASFALYNLAADPAERNDLANDQPDRTAAMQRGLAAWQKSVINSLNGEDYEK